MEKSIFTQGHDLLRRLLKAKRIAADRTQMDVAKLLGVPQSFVSKYEAGERRLDLVELAMVCDALGTTLNTVVREFKAQLDACQTDRRSGATRTGRRAKYERQ